MTGIRSIPQTNRTRHEYPWKDNSRRVMVPLWTPTAQGQVFEGRFSVPKRLHKTQEHTNERHEFDNLVQANIRRWSEWRAKGGWILNEEPTVRGPFKKPSHGSAKHGQYVRRAARVIGKSGNVQPVVHEEDDDYIYVMTARFVRETPLYVGLDDFLELNDMRARYGIPDGIDFLPWNKTDGDKDTGWVDPMRHAQERRERLGLKRKDYLTGKLEDPL